MPPANQYRRCAPIDSTLALEASGVDINDKERPATEFVKIVWRHFSIELNKSREELWWSVTAKVDVCGCGGVCVWGWLWGITLTFFAAEVWKCHVLEWDLFQECRSLAARVARDDLAAAEPVSKPCQPAVTVERVGQQVPGMEKKLKIGNNSRNLTWARGRSRNLFIKNTSLFFYLQNDWQQI